MVPLCSILLCIWYFPDIPSSIREKFLSADGTSKLCVDEKFQVSNSGKVYASVSSSVNRQHNKNKASRSDNLA